MLVLLTMIGNVTSCRAKEAECKTCPRYPNAAVIYIRLAALMIIRHQRCK